MKSVVTAAVIVMFAIVVIFSCQSSAKEVKQEPPMLSQEESFITIDTSKIPQDKFGEAVRYGRDLILNTAYYIGPKGIKGNYLGNKMNCTNCHQDGGTKPFSFNLMSSHDNYPQYRAREGKILTLAERVNNCVMRPHNGKPLPLEGMEMTAILSYFKWINSFVPKGKPFKGSKNMEVSFPSEAASTERGKILFDQNCARCHGTDGEGQWNADKTTYIYPPLWGNYGYQPGSSMHRIIKQAQWLKGNMPYDKVMVGKPFLTDEQALDIAAYVNNDAMHKRPNPKTFDYPYAAEKAIDYDKAPFIDTFSVVQHKLGPYQPIIDFWKEKGLKPIY
jgi:cytochrome c